jgi:lipoprotein-releasing system permease protein
MGVMNGLQHDMREKILVGSPSIRVTTFGHDLRMTRWRETLEVLKQEEGVAGAEPFVMGVALVKRQDLTRPQYAMIYGMPADGKDTVTTVRQHLVEGRGSFSFESPDGANHGVVIGDELANRLQVYPGDTIHIITYGSIRDNPHGVITGIEPSVAVVHGIFHTGMYDYDNEFVYTDLAFAQDLNGLGDAVTGIEARTVDRWAAPEIVELLRKNIDSNVYNIEDWQRQNKPLFSALKLEKLAMAIIVTLIVLVAAFNIVSVLTMLVQDKTREIGILRAMGLKSSSVRRIFLAQGLFIGLVGTTLGLIIGLAVSITVGYYKLIPLSPETYFIDYLPVRTEPLDVIAIAIGSMIISLLATLKPSSEAAALYPLEAIRRE